MYEIEFAVFALVVFVYALVSRRVEKLNFTAPMAFVVAGLLIGSASIYIVSVAKAIQWTKSVFLSFAW